VGGTNVRLQLIRLFHSDKTKREELKSLTKYSSQAYPSFIACVEEFLKNVDSSLLPRVGVVGMAGPVKDNKIPVTVNIPHWPVADGAEVASKFNLDSFIFINDFTAAGYGISRVTNSQCKSLNNGPDAKIIEGANSVKIVMGPGTGLGVGILIKNEEEGLYEPFPSEGGHVDFTVKN
jgi:glucokinase